MQFTVTMQTLDEIANLIAFLKKDSNKPVDEVVAFAPLNRRLEDKRLQGKYVGMIRHLPLSLRPKAKKLRKEQGIEAALAWGSTFKFNTKLSVPKSNGSSHRYRKTCEWCRRGFLAQQKRTRVCSKRCRDAEYRHRSIRKAQADASA